MTNVATTASMTGIYRTVSPPQHLAFRHTKIVATLGPATDPTGTVTELVRAGMDVARLNFSHGNHADHRKRFQSVRTAEVEVGRAVAVMADLCGPKIRLGVIDDLAVVAGDLVDLRDEETPSTSALPVSLSNFAARVKPHDRVLIDDGRIKLRVVERQGDVATCLVEVGGTLRARKGVNLPDSKLDEACLTPKDLEDLQVAVELGVDFVALSFVRHAADVHDLRSRLNDLGSDARIIAKVERPEAIEDLDAIVAASDGVMVARGDLGVEVGPHDVPLLQKRIIDQARRTGRTVITATQMLETMVTESEPTRAEVSDVANAILDGTAAVMLSAETASGAHPVHAVEVMASIAERVEGTMTAAVRDSEDTSAEFALMQAACGIARQLGAAAIVVPTSTGSTPRDLARFRTLEPIVATSDKPSVVRQLAMEWGVFPVLAATSQSLEATWEASLRAAQNAGWIQPDDLVVLSGRRALAGDPDASLLALHRVGNRVSETKS